MSEKATLRSGGIAAILGTLVAFGAVTFASGTRLGFVVAQIAYVIWLFSVAIAMLVKSAAAAEGA